MVPKKLKKTEKTEKKVKALVDIYLNSIGEVPLLSLSQEIWLAKRIELGSNWARQYLTKANLRLVVSRAKIYAKRSLNLTMLGLIQEGNIGLMAAVEKYDWRYNCRFSTYAVPRIDSAIQRALFYDNRGAIANFSMDDPIGKDSDESMHGIVGDQKAVCPSAKANQTSLQNIFNEVLQEIKEKEQQVIRLSFGISDGIAHTDKEIAKILGTTKERVRQIKAKALRRLKNHKRIAGLQ